MSRSVSRSASRLLDAIGIEKNLQDNVKRVVVGTFQRVGAQAVDRAIWYLGLGRQGVRLTGDSLKRDTERWDVEVSGWRTSAVAEAAELIVFRALETVFDLSGGESVAIETLNLRWISSSARGQSSGTVSLTWSLNEREQFRRESLANLTHGAVTSLTAFGSEASGLGIVQIELEVRARARRQISGAENNE